MSYAMLKNTGTFVQLSKSNTPNTVIVPQYGALSYSTLQRNPVGSDSNHRTFENAYGKDTECGTYVQRAVMY